MHDEEQPSPLAVFPSSQDSPAETMPSPHLYAQVDFPFHFHGADGLAGEHVCVDSILQVDEHPSPLSTVWRDVMGRDERDERDGV